jgi:hypothetical protein
VEKKNQCLYKYRNVLQYKRSVGERFFTGTRATKKEEKEKVVGTDLL